MKSAGQFALVLVTAPELKTARALARAALRGRLVACVNFVPGIESHYWWRGKIERGDEVLMVLKAMRRTLPALEKLILSKHPYNTAEFIVLPLGHGSGRYLDWWNQSCRA